MKYDDVTKETNTPVIDGNLFTTGGFNQQKSCGDQFCEKRRR